MPTSSTTKALDFWQARKRGERLPAHEILECDLCGDRMNADPDVFEATGLNICPECLEGYLDATTDQPRAEVGLVGGGH